MRLGRVSAPGKLILSMATASDGLQTPVALLAELVDAAAADREMVAYVPGTVNERALGYGAGHTAASGQDALQAHGLKLTTSFA